ncbi:THUMP domain-containing protein [Acinetobacter johnsonii]
MSASFAVRLASSNEHLHHKSLTVNAAVVDSFYNTTGLN